MHRRLTSLALVIVLTLASAGAMAQITTGATAPGAPNVNAAPSQGGGNTSSMKLKSHHKKHVKKARPAAAQ